MTPDEMELAEPTDDPQWSGYVALLRRARAAHVRWHGDDEPHEVCEFHHLWSGWATSHRPLLREYLGLVPA